MEKIHALGRRKKSIDRLFLTKGKAEININSIIIISLCSIITTIFVSIYPASKASSLDTVKTLKYE